MEELFNAFGSYAYPAVVLKEGRVGSEEEWLSEFWERKIHLIDNRLAEHGQTFLAGTESPTIADFKAFVFVSIVFDLSEDNFYPE
mmetsp:Transcript_9672/g.11908  ORF Transcript_9672/g.11908 Transcript_9672/m.11908 type:complete len:85 (+) Transcript_9672:326-580(+)